MAIVQLVDENSDHPVVNQPVTKRLEWVRFGIAERQRMLLTIVATPCGNGCCESSILRDSFYLKLASLCILAVLLLVVVKRVFADIKATKKIDFIPNIWRALASHPEHLELCWTGIKR